MLHSNSSLRDSGYLIFDTKKMTPEYNIILASKSPRRQELLKKLEINFKIKTNPVEENYPSHLKNEEIALYLAELKAESFSKELKINDLVITADTIVCIENEVLGKPKNKQSAKEMLKKLSGNKHTVYTGVCLKTTKRTHSFWASTEVYFRPLKTEEIDYYLSNYEPYDKAGAYGIQEWIGYIGIEKIEGSYFNVMGLPTQKLYDELQKFKNKQ